MEHNYKYKKNELIDKGTYASVYKGILYNNIIPEEFLEVAIKELDTEEEESFNRVVWTLEKNILTQLKEHINIIKYIGALNEGSVFALIFLYIPRNLRTFVNTIYDSYNDFSFYIKSFIFQLLNGIKYIHSRNIIHCDIKLRNILVTDEFILKICDFGLSLSYDVNNVSDQNFNIQSLWYRSPEVLLKTNYDFSIDIWSIGCIFFELKYNQILFNVEDEKELFLKIIQIFNIEIENIDSKNIGLYSAINNSIEIKKEIKKLPKFKSLCNCNNRQLYDVEDKLISKMLKFDKNKRASANEILKNEFYFNSIKIESEYS